MKFLSFIFAPNRERYPSWDKKNKTNGTRDYGNFNVGKRESIRLRDCRR